MATHFNLASGDVIPQPDFAVTRNENGGFEASRSYYMLKSTWDTTTLKNRFAVGAAITDADATIDDYYSFLSIRSITPQVEPGQHIKLVVNYTGHISGQFGGEGGGDLSLEALPTYRMEGRLRDLPFSNHPKWVALDDTQKFGLGGLIDGKFETTESGLFLYVRSGDDLLVVKNSLGEAIEFTGDGVEFAKRIAQGETTYQAPTLTWTERTQGNIGLNSAQIGKLGEISTPRGSPPTISGYDWMLTSASQEQQGLLYQTTLEWTLSPPDGWDEFVYTFT